MTFRLSQISFSLPWLLVAVSCVSCTRQSEKFVLGLPLRTWSIHSPEKPRPTFKALQVYCTDARIYVVRRLWRTEINPTSTYSIPLRYTRRFSAHSRKPYEFVHFLLEILREKLHKVYASTRLESARRIRDVRSGVSEVALSSARRVDTFGICAAQALVFRHTVRALSCRHTFTCGIQPFVGTVL